MKNLDKTREDWQRDNGFNDKYFATEALHLIQAQQVATNLLKHHGKYLGQNQANTLNNFLLAMKSKTKRKKLKASQAYTVMNIGSAVNRKLFKSLRNSK